VQPPIRFIIKVGYTCNNRCLFCHSASLASLGDLDFEQVCLRIRQARAAGAEAVLFSGGEPTIRPDLEQLARHCRDQKLPFGLITNGRMLSYLPLLERLVGLGLDYVYLSLHGPGEIHDAVTRVPGSFTQTLAACRRLARYPRVEVTCNTVVIEHNRRELGRVVSLLAPLENIRVKFSYVEPRGGALDVPSLVPHPVQAAADVSRALDLAGKQAEATRRPGVDGFPHCLDTRFASLQDDMFSHGIVALREVDEDDFFPVDYANMTRPEACRGCLRGDQCRCTWTGALERFGDDYLKPVRGGLSNSFNYHPLSELTCRESTHHHAAPPPIAPERRLRVCPEKGPVLDVATDTADFSPEEILRIRDETQQVYLQLDQALCVDDFPGQLRKLQRLPGYTSTEDGDEVPAFTVRSEDLFTAAEVKVRRILAGISGHVLDVGCGQSRYLDLLEPGLADGRVSYLGVDPEPGANVKDFARRGLISLRETTLEEAPLPRAAFDWVLVMRSHNHLLDLWTAYSRLLGTLKWGGHLLVVDNVAFGLVRSPGSRRRLLELEPSLEPEHLRNHSQDDAARFLARFPLVEVTRHSVGADSANQWVLLFRKLWPGGTMGRDNYPT